MTTQYDRANPFVSHILERFLLTQSHSSKKTWHLSLSLAGSFIAHRPGDSIAILPENDPRDVEEFLKTFHLKGSEILVDSRAKSEIEARSFFAKKVNLQKAHPALFRALAKEKSDALPLKLLKERTIDFALHQVPSLFLPLLPRFYSIASSQRTFPDEIHLAVAETSYLLDGRLIRGVGSSFLCERAEVGHTPIPCYLQPSHHFCLPEDPNTPVIFIGPGTGIAPFRAFMQERLATQAKGRNWLFFGERNRDSDFYYGEFWQALERQGHLKLSFAFSRDQAEKVYVQHRMWEERLNLWSWIQEGAHFYVCGDAEEMARDVEAMLLKIFMKEGSLTEEGARHKLKELRMQKRYLLDVY